MLGEFIQETEFSIAQNDDIPLGEYYKFCIASDIEGSSIRLIRSHLTLSETNISSHIIYIKLEEKIKMILYNL